MYSPTIATYSYELSRSEIFGCTICIIVAVAQIIYIIWYYNEEWILSCEVQGALCRRIRNAFGIQPVNIGSIAYGRWTSDSDLDLAIGYYDRYELVKILSIAGERGIVFEEIKGSFAGK